MKALDAFNGLVQKGVVSVEEFHAVELLVAQEMMLLEGRYLGLLAEQANEPDETITNFGDFYQWLAKEKRCICTILDFELCEAIEADDPDDVAVQTLVRRVLANRQHFLDIGLGIVQAEMDEKGDPDTASLLQEIELIVAGARAAGTEPDQGTIESMRVLREALAREQSGEELSPVERREQFERCREASVAMMKWIHELSNKGNDVVEND